MNTSILWHKIVKKEKANKVETPIKSQNCTCIERDTINEILYYSLTGVS